MSTFNEEKQETTLYKIHQKEEERYLRDLARSKGLPFVDLTTKTIQGKSLRILPKEEAQRAEVAPFYLLNDTLHIGLHNPDKAETGEVLEKLAAEYELEKYITTENSLEKVWDHYDNLSRSTKTEGGAISIKDENIEQIRQKIQTIDDAQEFINSLLKQEERAPTSKLVEVLLGGSLALKASDIHLEPEEEIVRIRYRIDGILVNINDLDHQVYQGVLSRLKLSSGMKLNVTNEAQDGRFTINAKDSEIEVRSSVIPGPYGDSIVMRVLDPASIKVDLDELGIHPTLLAVFREQIRKPHGMILNTGPTGSGKTTTLYSFLRDVNSEEVKIITIENPIEYHLAGIVQTQVNHASGYDFLSGLRSALRQDPDVIMVGEIRDEETARTAINAALTGHLVFSTLHTNNAAGTFPRLIDLGVDPKILTSAVNTAMAQRLVRKLCEHCKKEVPLEGEDQEVVETALQDLKKHNPSYLKNLQKEKVWTAQGCEQCNGLGYQGRIGIFEAVLTDHKLEETLRTNPSTREIEETAKNQGIPSMAQDGVVKVLKGVTSLEELGRIVDIT